MSCHKLILAVAILVLSYPLQATEVCTSRVIDAPVRDVWLKIRDFGSHGDWIEGSPKVWLEGGTGTTVGVKSYTQFANGDTFVEVLTALDDKNHMLKYDVIGELPLPIYNTRGEFTLHSITTGSDTLIERCLYYDTDLPKEERETFAEGRKQALSNSLDLLAGKFTK